MNVSVKAVVRLGDAVLLGENDRDEWELLGGRPEPGESFEEALRREVQEEAGLRVEVGDLVLDAPLEVLPGTFVRIVAFRCRVVGEAVIAGSDEHCAVRFVPDDELATLRLPSVYRRAIVAEAKMRR